MALTLYTLKEGMPFEVHEICMDAIKELNCACGKFPLFPDEFTRLTPHGIRIRLADEREVNDAVNGDYTTADSVIREEFLEYCEKVSDLDPEGARKELVQTIAMLLRSYIHLDHYCRPV